MLPLNYAMLDYYLNAEGELRVYYRASAEQRKVIGAYLGRSH